MADVFHNPVEHGNNVSAFLCQKQFVFTPVVFCDVFSQPTVGHKVIDVFGNDALLALDRLNQVILADARVFVDNNQVKEIRLVQAVFAAASVDFGSDLAVEDGTPFFNARSHILFLLKCRV